MRRWRIVIALAVLAVSCGEVVGSGGDPGVGPVVPATETTVDAPVNACRQFIEQTVSLADELDYERYRATLGEAIRPVVDLALDRKVLTTGDEGVFVDQNLAMALEHVYAGNAEPDYLWTVERLGELLAADGVEGCDTLWHNLGPMPSPPPLRWDEPPAAEIDSEYVPGTPDHACDVFIETINAMIEDRPMEGAEYGPTMAEAAETLIGELRVLGIDGGAEELALVVDLWRTYRLERSLEESMRPLEIASEELSDVGAGRCGEVFAAIIPGYGEPPPVYVPPDPITIDVVAVDDFDPGMACGFAKVDSMDTVPSTQPLDADAQGAVEALGANLEGEPFVETYLYEIFSRTDEMLILLGSGPDGSLSFAKFLRVDGRWEPAGWGGCEWRADRYENVAWQVHPDFPVDRSAQTIDLLATDWCGIVTEKDHEVTVVADFADEAVTFEVWEDHAPRPNPDGTYSAETLACAMGLRVHLRVTLPEPIGDRPIEGEHDSLDMP